MIKEFQGEYRWLSNFWPCKIEYQGDIFPSTEHFYVAMKTTDKFDRETIRLTSDAGKVKRLGRKLQIRPDWEELKLKVMLYALRKKFSKDNPDLMQLLLNTGESYIQEGNKWNDKFWGVCLNTNTGENNLGKLLMQVRNELRSAS